MPSIYGSPRAGTIADLMRQRGQVDADAARSQGDTAAQRAMASGQAWGNAIQNISNTVGGTLRDYAQAKAAAPEMAAQAAYRDAQTKKLTAETADMDESRVRTAISGAAKQIVAAGYDPAQAEGYFRSIAKHVPEYEQPLLASLGDPAMLKKTVDALVMLDPKYKAPEGYTLNRGDVRYGPDHQEVARGEAIPPPNAPQPTTASLALQAAGGDPAKALELARTPAQPVSLQRAEVLLDGKPSMAVFNPQTGTYSVAGQDVTARVKPIPPQGPSGGEPLESVIDPKTGQPVLMPRSQARGMAPATSREQPTEDERKSAGWFKQMGDAVKVMDEVEGQLNEKDLYQIQTLPQEELIGMMNRGQMSEPAKRYLRAFEQFTEARLRSVSGAAISAGEYAGDRRTYAKQYGETAQLNKDRRAAREGAIGSLRARAYRALPKDAGTPSTVKMVAPNGQEQDVPADQVDHYKSLGAKVKG